MTLDEFKDWMKTGHKLENAILCEGLSTSRCCRCIIEELSDPLQFLSLRGGCGHCNLPRCFVNLVCLIGKHVRNNLAYSAFFPLLGLFQIHHICLEILDVAQVLADQAKVALDVVQCTRRPMPAVLTRGTPRPNQSQVQAGKEQADLGKSPAMHSGPVLLQ